MYALDKNAGFGLIYIIHLEVSCSGDVKFEEAFETEKTVEILWASDAGDQCAQIQTIKPLKIRVERPPGYDKYLGEVARSFAVRATCQNYRF